MKLRIPKQRNGRILLIGGGGLLLVGLVAWYLLKPPALPTLLTASVTRGDIEQTVEATGAVDASKLVSVGAQASGQITSLAVELNDQVKAGDLIAEIDSTTQSNSLRNEEAALTATRAQRAEKMAALKEAQLTFERQRTLLAQDAVSRADYETAEASLASIRAQVEAIDAQIVQNQTSVDTARANLGYTRITAPMDGTVVAIVAKEGQTVNANQSTPTIIKLANLAVMTINAEISEADVIKVNPGQDVYFTILGDQDKRYYAKLRLVEPAPSSIESDSTTSTTSSSSSEAIYYNGVFDVDNPDGVLRISMTAHVSIVLDSAKDALLIPATALGDKDKQGQYTVMVMTDDRHPPQPRKVRVGINNNVTAQVLEGLDEGDRVVIGEASVTESASSSSRPGGPGGGGPPPMM